MKTLEGMARDLFNKFSMRETGKLGDWSYLSNTRKLEWMKEVLIMAKYFLDEIHSDIKPLQNNQRTNTVYESGYNDGVRSERAACLSLVENKLQKLVDEFKDFEHTTKK